MQKKLIAIKNRFLQAFRHLLGGTYNDYAELVDAMDSMEAELAADLEKAQDEAEFYKREAEFYRERYFTLTGTQDGLK